MHDAIESCMGERFMPSARQTNVMYFNVTESEQYWHSFTFLVVTNPLKNTICQVLCSIQEEYLHISLDKATKTLLLFSTTYLCEDGFSSNPSIQATCYNRLTEKTHMRIQLSSMKPHNEEAFKNVYHFSHYFFGGAGIVMIFPQNYIVNTNM